MSQLPTETELEMLEARVAARIAAGLAEQAQALPHDVAERLRFARERALERGRAARRVAAAAPAAAVVTRGGRGTAALGGPPSWWLRLATVLPLAMLVAGLVLIQDWMHREQVLAAAEIDVKLLADDLPPDAYSDPGFVEFLKAPPPDES